MIILYAIIFILAVIGIYMVSIMVVQSIKHEDFEAARCYVNELLKDLLSSRGQFRLECSDFPLKLKNDIQSYLTGDDLKRWLKRFEMKSQSMEEWGMTPYGLPYYQFKILMPSEDSQTVYEEIVINLAQNALALASCTERRVCIEWYATTESDYKICRLIYARTASEQEKFLKIINYKDKAIIEAESNDITDVELDRELHIFGDKNDEYH